MKQRPTWVQCPFQQSLNQQALGGQLELSVVHHLPSSRLNYQVYLIFSAESSGIGATVWTAGRFLLVAPFTKLDDDEEEEDPESTAPIPKTEYIQYEKQLVNFTVS